MNIESDHRIELFVWVTFDSFICFILVTSKAYDKFYCSTEEGHHQITCPDETALLTDVSIRKIYRRTQMCAPDVHSDYLVHCQGHVDGSMCEGNKTCSIEVSSRNYVQCGEKTYSPTYFFVKYTCTQSKINNIEKIKNWQCKNNRLISSYDVHRYGTTEKYTVWVHRVASVSSSYG
jgi:hypothetical protein